MFGFVLFLVLFEYSAFPKNVDDFENYVRPDAQTHDFESVPSTGKTFLFRFMSSFSTLRKKRIRVVPVADSTDGPAEYFDPDDLGPGPSKYTELVSVPSVIQCYSQHEDDKIVNMQQLKEFYYNLLNGIHYLSADMMNYVATPFCKCRNISRLSVMWLP